MKTPGICSLVIAVTALSLTIGVSMQAQDTGGVTLVNTCLITENVKQLVDFYEPVLSIKARKSGEDYAEFPTRGGTLAIFSAAAQERYIPHSTLPGRNQSVILEFRVTDVDEEYRRLQSLVKTWVKAPTTQPWGTRSTYFRDPDGNLVDFFVPPKPHGSRNRPTVSGPAL